MKSTSIILGSMLGAILLSLTGCAMDTTGSDDLDQPSDDNTGTAQQAMISAGQCQALSDGCSQIGADPVDVDAPPPRITIVRRNQCRNWLLQCKDSIGTADPCPSLEANCADSHDAGICTILQQTCTGY